MITLILVGDFSPDTAVGSFAHIIISYRRADSDAIAGRMRDKLATHYREKFRFMDIDSILFGIIPRPTAGEQRLHGAVRGV